MYTKHFGLKVLPFENVPDPAFYFDEGDHARIHNRVKESLRAGRGLMVVSGPIGSGKTTLSQMIISEFSGNIKLIWMAEPPGNSLELFLFIAHELGLEPASPERVFVINEIRDALLKLNSEGSQCLLIIDESHLMTDDTINGIRLLNNLEEGATKLIQILLLGQEEFIEKINKSEMEPFRQRIATMEILGKMNSEGIRHYIAHRIKVAGGNPSIFEDTGCEAVDLAFDSGGTPRVINSLCDKALNVAFEREKSIVDAHDVYEATKGLGIGKEVFHYIVSLRSRERQNGIPSNGGNDSADNVQETAEEAVKIAFKEAPAAGLNINNEQVATDQKYSKVPDFTLQVAEKEIKSLKAPVVLLVLSIITLIASIFFYCDRSGSYDLASCLLDIFSF